MQDKKHILSTPAFRSVGSQNYTVTPFQVYKRWLVDHNVYSSTYGMSLYKATYPHNETYPKRQLPISASKYVRIDTHQDRDPRLVWYQIDHLFYKSGTENDYNSGDYMNDVVKRDLYETASVMSIPQRWYGEKMKEGGFVMYDRSLVSGSDARSASLADDGFGNIVDRTINTTNFAPETSLQFYMGFNEKYVEYTTPRRKTSWVQDKSRNRLHGTLGGSVAFSRGIPTTGIVENSGTQADFDGSSWICVDNDRSISFTDKDDFAISFWVKPPSAQVDTSLDYVWLMSKQGIVQTDRHNEVERVVERKEVAVDATAYPFSVKMPSTGANYGKVYFSRSGGGTERFVTSSALPTGVYSHVVCQKSGSTFQIYVDGVLDGSKDCSVNGSVLNNYKMVVGGKNKTSGLFSGSLDEIRIYNTVLSSDNIASLANNDYHTGSAYQTNRVGNIFYKHGIVVVSDPRPRYFNTFMGKTATYDYASGDNGFDGMFRATQTIYEHEVVCKIRASDLNFTMNPTVRIDGDPSSDTLRDFATGSEFTPYITTIGLYNDKYELLAVAKLANATPKRDDVDLNFIVRFDA